MTDLIEIGLLIYIIYYLNQIVKIISNQDDYIYKMFSELSSGNKHWFEIEEVEER